MLLMNIMGGPASNARLNMLLREKYGLVYTVEASYLPYIDTGFAGIYFGTDAPNLARCRELTEKVIEQYSHTLMTDLQLDRAKKQLLDRYPLQKTTTRPSVCLWKSLLSFGKVFSHNELVAQIESVTPSK